jgi:hypothetical protein
MSIALKPQKRWPKLPLSLNVIVRCQTSATIFVLLYATIRRVVKEAFF